MPRYPRVNNPVANTILDSDLVDVVRQLPNGDVVSLKANLKDFKSKAGLGGTSYPEIGGLFSSLWVDLYNAPKEIPVLPTETNYGASKNIRGYQIITPSLEVDSSILDEVIATPEQAWLAEIDKIKVAGGQLAFAEGFKDIHTDWDNQLTEMTALVTQLKDETKKLLDKINDSNVGYDISGLQKAYAALNDAGDKLNEAIADVTSKIAAIDNALLP
jgi:hypothetical protein